MLRIFVGIASERWFQKYTQHVFLGHYLSYCSVLVFFNPIAIRLAKTPWSFGQSECNRVKAANSINSKILGNKNYCYNEGSLYVVGYLLMQLKTNDHHRSFYERLNKSLSQNLLSNISLYFSPFRIQKMVIRESMCQPVYTLFYS